jgi:integrase
VQKITGRGTIEKVKGKPNTWKITHYLGDKGEDGKYKRAPKRTVHGKKSEAFKALEEYRKELEGSIDIEPDEITVAEYARQFHELRAGTMNSPLSYKRESLDINHIIELFPKVKIQELTAAHIRRAYADARKKKKLSEDALHKTHVKLRQVLQAAFAEEKILRNPCDLVKFNRPTPAERKSLSAEEAARLYASVMEEPLNGQTIALLLLVSTGIRRGEALGLTWQHLYPEQNAIYIAYQYANDKKLRPPKSKESRRWLSISQEIADSLERWKQLQAESFEVLGIEQDDLTPVASNDYGSFMDPNNFSRWFRAFSVDHGFGEFTEALETFERNGKTYTRGKGYKGLQLHELRHTQATLLIAARADWKTVQQRLGHAQASTTMNIYAHAVGANDVAAAQTIDSILRSKKGSF